MEEDNSQTVGPYTKNPFHPNIKCIIFSGVLMASYWFLPREKNIYLLPVIFVISYVAMAWYDHIYNCNRKLYTGSFSDFGTILDSIFKPQKIKKSDVPPEKLKRLLPEKEQRRVYLRNVYLFHLLVVVPLIGYIGYNGRASDKRTYGALLGLSVIAGFYHSYRLYDPRV